jgi:signal transduction histidine kinase
VGSGIREGDGNEAAHQRIEVGRLTLLDTELRPHFGEPDALLLQEIADMCAEALENEHHIANAQRTHRMQRSVTRLAAALDPPQNEGLLGEAEQQQQHYSSVSLENKTPLCPDRVQTVIDTMRESLEANTVYAIDVSSFRISSSRGIMSRQPSASPRTGGGYPSTPWLSASSSLPVTTPPIADSGAGPQLAAFAETPEEGNEGMEQATPPAKPRAPRSRPTSSAGSRSAASTVPVPSSPNFRRSSQHFSRSSISSSSIGSTGSNSSTPAAVEEQVCSFPDGDEHAVAVVATANGRAEDLCLSTSEARSSICTFFARRPRSSDMYIFRADLSSDADSDSPSSVDETELEIFRDGLEVPTYLAVPVFDHERQPLYLLVVRYAAPRAMEEADLHFSRACGTLLLSSVLRHRARLVDQAQLSFVRRVQHELRTPLHAILGITDFLRGAAADGEGAKNLLEDNLLPELLQSIRLAGSNLSATLDDVLDLGTASGLRSESDAASHRVEDVLLAAEIEDAVESELEQAEMAARQDRFVDAQQVVDAHLRPESVPTVVISVDPNMRQRWRIDRTRTKKVLCKLLNNALRYNIAKGGLVEVKVRMHPGSESQVDIIISDTGIGMSKSFVNNELSKVSGRSGCPSEASAHPVLTALRQGRRRLQPRHWPRLHDRLLAGGADERPAARAQHAGHWHARDRHAAALAAALLARGRSAPQGVLRAKVSRACVAAPGPLLTASTRSVHFAGFDGRAMERVREQIMERLDENGVRLTASPAACDLLVVAEHTLGQTPMAESELPAKPASLPVPPPSGPNARILVVASSTIGRHRTLHHLSEHPVQLFKPPFGPTALETMDAFLSDKAPLQLKLPSLGQRTVSHDRPTPVRQDSYRRASAVPALPVAPELKPLPISPDSFADIKVVPPQPLYDASATKSPVSVPSHDSVAPHKVVAQPDTTVIMPEQDVSALAAEEFRVLIVEDNPLNLRLLSTVVKRLGFPYDEARDGQEAVDKFLTFRPACVLLDMSMPVMVRPDAGSWRCASR